ncbi:MAG: DNA repair protein [Ignavibacteria bacterium]|nr:DNA repair protein [Ignavibacteria bacterium]
MQVHTPDSLVHNYSGSDPWDRFIREIEQLPAEFKVIGINDYIFLDGYKRILAEKANGRLANIELFLPVIELRLDKFGGSPGHLRRVNYHVIFSNELNPDMIEQQFLNALSSKYILSPEYEQFSKTGKWAALPTTQSLKDLGQLIIESVPEKEGAKYGDPLIEGFNNLCISLKATQDALQSHYFTGKVVTAVGKTEWAAIKWNDHSIAEKKTIINGANLVFISSETVEGYAKAKKSLTEAGVNDLLLDCSDAHFFSDAGYKDRIGKCFTWIKADPTFEGLLQVLSDPNERVFVGEIPPKLVRVQNNKTKYMTAISIKRKQNATLSETWFDNTIPLNPDLVAIIGNKGKGKSAITDTIGLLSNTKQHRDFTFLSTDNFRQPKDNKAKHFQATLTWESGTTTTKELDEPVNEQKPEFVNYIPQNYLEKICTQLGRIEESDFDRELKKVIFSHVGPADRLGKASLDELIAYKTSEASAKIQILKQELRRINEEIVAQEEKAQPEYRQKLDNLLAQKRHELEAYEKSKPVEVPKPETDPVGQREISEVTGAIETARNNLAEYDNQIAVSSQQQAEHVQLVSIVDKLIARLENLERQVQTFVAESQSDFDAVGLSLDSILKISIDNSPLLDKRQSILDQKAKVDEQLDPSKPGSLTQKKLEIEGQVDQLQTKLDEPNKKYQAYTIALKVWEQQREAIIGHDTSTGTMKYYEKQIQILEAVPEQLKVTRARRLAKAKEIHAVVRQLADTYRGLYAPVHQFIETSPLAKEKFQLNFEVGIVDTGFESIFFDIVSHGVAGTFCGVEEGQKMLKSILTRHDFNTEAGIEAFLTEIINSLENDQRPGGKSISVTDQIRKDKSVEALYDLIFSLDFLKPRYSLRMGDKELHQLSPGERGALLLVFYLLVDKDDIPLVIDQPEENLDNQTVYELLVPCMKEAKQRRQILIVTHNPNLAVVCDAEQIICADLDKRDNYRMNYLSGALENPVINKAVVDILEGTRPAFDKRDEKYL